MNILTYSQYEEDIELKNVYAMHVQYLFYTILLNSCYGLTDFHITRQCYLSFYCQ